RRTPRGQRGRCALGRDLLPKRTQVEPGDGEVLRCGRRVLHSRAPPADSSAGRPRELMIRRHHRHRETHQVARLGWLRAAVLGANDGIVSTASLILGAAEADGSQRSILAAGVAALVAGAMSMAAGEYVSVSAQSDSEAADLAKEKRELAEEPQSEQE